MKKIITVLLIGILGSAFSQSINTLESKQKDSIQNYIKDFPVNTSVSLGIIRKGKIIYQGYTVTSEGCLEVDNHQSVFEIGSISKVFTSMLLAQLQLEGKLNIDDPVQKYMKLKLNNHPQFTFKQLANHTSGLPRLPGNIFESMVTDPKNPYANYGEEQLKAFLKKKLQLLSPPGSQYAYSNLGAGLLGYVLCQIEKKSYEELLQHYIFEPYQMKHSTSDRTKVRSGLIHGQNKNGEVIPNWDFNVLSGAGGILSSVYDLGLFAIKSLEENARNQLMQQETFRVNSNLSLSLGWHILSKQDRTWLWHNGATGGYSSSLAMDVKRQHALIILTNLAPDHPKHSNVDKLCFYLLKSIEE